MPGKSAARVALEQDAAERALTPGSVYLKAFDARATEYCLLSATNEELAKLFNVDPSAIEQWIRDKPSFRRAVQLGREGADSRVARALYRRALGATVWKERAVVVQGIVKTMKLKEELPPDTNAAALWLSNRQRGKWRSSSASDASANAFDLAAFVGALGSGIAKGLQAPGHGAKVVDAKPVKDDGSLEDKG